MRYQELLGVALLVGLMPSLAAAQSKEAARVTDAIAVFEEIMQAPDSAVPRQILEKAEGNKFKIGVDASVAAGPVGRDAEASTDIQLRAQILSYSRTRGLFAGVTLKGSAFKPHRDANERFYGSPFNSRAIVIDKKTGTPEPVPAWQTLLAPNAG